PPCPSLFPYTTLFRSTQPEHPVAHRGHMHAVSAVTVHGQLGLGRRAGRREDERGILRGRIRDAAVVAIAGAKQLVPGQLVLVGRSEEHTSELQSRFDL